MRDFENRNFENKDFEDKDFENFEDKNFEDMDSEDVNSEEKEGLGTVKKFKNKKKSGYRKNAVNEGDFGDMNEQMDYEEFGNYDNTDDAAFEADTRDAFKVIEGGRGKKDPAVPAAGDAVSDAVKQYMNDIRGIALLTADEEHELGRQIAAGIEAADCLADEETADLLGLREREELNRMVEAGKVAQNHMVEANLRLVISIAKEYRECGLELMDLIQHGNIGLMKAVRRFDYRKGNRFSTYANYWIREEIRSALTNTAHPIRLPSYVNKDISKMKRVTQALKEKLGKDPSTEEIAGALGMEPERVETLLSLTRRTMDSLDREVGEDGESALGDFIVDEQAMDPADVAVKNDEARELYDMIGMLDEREQFVLRRRYGLGGAEPMTLEAIGKQLGISRERVRTIQEKAEEKLRYLYRRVHMDDDHNWNDSGKAR